MSRLLLVAIAACLVLTACRDEEKINLKADNHRLQRELTFAKNRVTELENELRTANMLYAPPPSEPVDPNATSTGGVGQRGPVTGPPVPAAIAQYRRPYRARPPLRAIQAGASNLPAPVQTGQALSLAPEPDTGIQAPQQLVPLTPEQLEALQQGG